MGGSMTEQRSDLVNVRDLEVHFAIRQGVLVDRHVGDVRAVDGVSFEVRRGETLGLVGESGCGKTTTGRAILRLIEPTSGTVTFDGHDISALSGSELRRLRRRMQMVFQDPYSSLNPRRNVASIVAEPLRVHGIAEGREAEEKVRELLGVVGLPKDSENRYPHEFS